MDLCNNEAVEQSSAQDNDFAMKPATPSVIRRGLCILKNEGKPKWI